MTMQNTFQPRTGGPVTVHILGDLPATAPVAGTLAGTDSRKLSVVTERPVAAGAAVKIDVEGGLVLGEVEGCAPLGDKFEFRVAIDQVVPSVSELAQLVQRIIGDPARAATTPERTTVRSAEVRTR